MHNRDKGLLPYRQQALVAHVLQRLQPQLDNILIVANRHLSEYEQFGYPVISDWPEPSQVLSFDGPLRGVCRALQFFEAQSPSPDWLLLAPCDAPHYPIDLLQRYQHELSLPGEQDWECLLPHDGERLQPLFALLRLNCLAPLEQTLSRSERGLRRALSQLKCKQIRMPPDGFSNINEPNQLDE